MEVLDISFCVKITDETLVVLGKPPNKPRPYKRHALHMLP